MCVTVVQWSRSCLNVKINRVLLPATRFSVSLYRFFFFLLFGLFFFNTIFPFGLFFFILNADPAGHALGSIIYFEVRSFILKKVFQKLLICIPAIKKKKKKKKKHKLSRHVHPLKQLIFFVFFFSKS